MKICVLGFEGAASRLIFEDERLVNLRRLMDLGVYGNLKGVIAPSAVPGWMCMATSQDPGSLGIYGRRVRNDFTYGFEEVVSPSPINGLAIWNQLGEGKKAILLDVPPESARNTQWHEVCSLLSEAHWEYFHFVDSGRELTGAGHDAQAAQSYILEFDEQVGAALELLDDQTIVLVNSTHGVRRSFDLNEWLMQAGYLFLKGPKTTGPLKMQMVDWTKTRAWSDGGDSSQIFLNVQGREPSGMVPATEYVSLQEELIARSAALGGEEEPHLSVFKPKQIYRNLRGVAPDLMACVDWETAQNGAFILVAPECPLSGAYEGAHLLDLAPTLLDLAGHAIPESMQGRSLVAGLGRKASDGSSMTEDEKIIRDRLAGLGYV